MIRQQRNTTTRETGSRAAIPATAAAIRANAAALLGPKYTQQQVSALIDAAGQPLTGYRALDQRTAELYHSADIARHTDISTRAVIAYQGGRLLIFFFTA